MDIGTEFPVYFLLNSENKIVQIKKLDGNFDKIRLCIYRKKLCTHA